MASGCVRSFLKLFSVEYDSCIIRIQQDVLGSWGERSSSYLKGALKYFKRAAVDKPKTGIVGIRQKLAEIKMIGSWGDR